MIPRFGMDMARASHDMTGTQIVVPIKNEILDMRCHHRLAVSKYADNAAISTELKVKCRKVKLNTIKKFKAMA